MINKVLISLYVPMLNNTYDVFIPINEIMWKINKLMVKSISDLTDSQLPIGKNYVLINMENGRIYDKNEIVINTDIRNSSKIALIDL